MIPYTSPRETARIKSKQEQPGCNSKFTRKTGGAPYDRGSAPFYYNRDTNRGSVERRPDNARTDNGRETVLVVDDDPDMRLLYSTILEDFGYKVLDEPDALSALAAVENTSEVKLVITDYKMPRMNGLEFADILRKRRPGMPVILLTACANIENYLLARDLGVFEFVDKSVKKGELARIVRSALAATEYGIEASPCRDAPPLSHPESVQ